MKKYTANPNFVVREIRHEKLLVPISGDLDSLDSLFTLNETASRIWDLASQGNSRESIAQMLQEEFEVRTQEALADVDSVLQDLQQIQALLPESD